MRSTFGCARPAASRAARWKRATAAGLSSARGDSTLTATSRPAPSVARYTADTSPWRSAARRRYGPSWQGISRLADITLEDDNRVAQEDAIERAQRRPRRGRLAVHARAEA